MPTAISAREALKEIVGSNPAGSFALFLNTENIVDIKMQRGEHLNIALPNGKTVQVEFIEGQVMIDMEGRILLSMHSDDVDWCVTTPVQLDPQGQPIVKQKRIAPTVTPTEAKHLIKIAADRMTTAAWWMKKDGWDTEVVDENGNRTYSRKYDRFEAPVLELVVSPEGQKSVVFGPIPE